MSEKIYGWVGKILRVDLTKGKFSTVPTMDYAKKFIGGRGINAKIYWDEAPPGISAFDPENRLIITTGPLSGTPAPTSGRNEVGGKSPQTYPNESYTISGIGGWWGPELKYAGYDGLIIHGRSEKPVYLYIRDGVVQIRDASHLWGKDTYTTQEMLWEELGEGRKVQILTIGPAGENLSRFGIIMHMSSSAAGQGGFGSVMGSKKLKAIAVRGTGYVEVARPEELLETSREASRWIYRPDDRPEVWSNIPSFHRIGWSFFQGQKAAGRKWLKKYTRKGEGCHACPLACRIRSNIPDSAGRHTSAKCNQFWYEKYDGEKHKGITDVFVKAAQISDQLGVNAFELIGMIPWLESCYKEKILTKEEIELPMEDIGELNFAESLVKKIAYKEGIGKILAEGTPRAADIVGRGSKKYVLHMNRGFAQHWNPRLWSPQALFWAVESRHPQSVIHNLYWVFRMYVKDIWPAAGWAEASEVAAWAEELFGTAKAIDYSDENFYDPIHAYTAKWALNYNALHRSMILCCYGPFPILFSWYSKLPNHKVPLRSPDLEAKLFTLTTGTDYIPDGKTALEIGARIVNLERAIVMREGRTRKDDTLADYLFEKTETGKVTGPGGRAISVKRKLDREKFEKLKDEYYKLREWDIKTGHPTRGALEKLDLKDVADQLEKEGLLPKV